MPIADPDGRPLEVTLAQRKLGAGDLHVDPGRHIAMRQGENILFRLLQQGLRFCQLIPLQLELRLNR